MRMLFLIASVCVVCGCFSTPEVTLPKFNESKVQFSNERGTGRIEGDLFARTRGGDVKVGAGAKIQLSPYNAHINAYWKSLGNTAPLDYKAKRYIESTVADSEGRFRFDNLAPGRYIIHASFEWWVGDKKYDRQLVAATKTVNVENNDTARVSLQGRGVR